MSDDKEDKCSAVGCTNSRHRNSDLTFYQFPKDNEGCGKWALNCGLKYRKGKATEDFAQKSICEEHFEVSQFMNPASKGKPMQCKKLIPTAEPTLFSISTTETNALEVVADAPQNEKKDDQVKPGIPSKPSRPFIRKYMQCKFGSCKSDSRELWKEKNDDIYFLQFPQPCSRFRNGRRHEPSKCTPCKTAIFWLKASYRKGRVFNKLEHIKPYHYICSLHFHNPKRKPVRKRLSKTSTQLSAKDAATVPTENGQSLPAVGQSVLTVPDLGQSTVGQSVPTVPDLGQSTVGQSVPTVPDLGQSTVGQSVPTVPDVGQSTVGQSVPTVPDVNRSVSTVLAVGQSESAVPAVGQSVSQSTAETLEQEEIVPKAVKLQNPSTTFTATAMALLEKTSMSVSRHSTMISLKSCADGHLVKEIHLYFSGEIEVKVHNRLLPPSHPFYGELKKISIHPDNAIKLCVLMDLWRPCSGIPLDTLVSTPQPTLNLKKGIYSGAPETVFSEGCDMLLNTTSISCPKCRMYKQRELSRRLRNKNLRRPRLDNMAPSELAGRLKAGVKERKSLRMRLKRMELKLKRNKAWNNLVDGQGNDLIALMRKALKEISKESFAWVFLTEQLKAAGSHKIQWQPLMIQQCLHLRAKSPTAYAALRSWGLQLPTTKTLRRHVTQSTLPDALVVKESDYSVMIEECEDVAATVTIYNDALGM